MESIFHYPLPGGELASIAAVSEQGFRIRIQKEGDRESALNRYSIIQEPAEAFPLKVEETADALILATEKAKLHFQKRDGSIALFDASGKVLLQSCKTTPQFTDRGFRCSISAHGGRTAVWHGGRQSGMHSASGF